MTCEYDGPAPGFLKESFQTAKKSHDCEECGRKIKAGEKYKVWIGKWDGDLYGGKQCQLCAKIFDDLIEMDFCPPYHGLWEFIAEELEQDEY